ncbi:MAG: agmatine deiminase family protein [Rubripirellula sp.]
MPDYSSTGAEILRASPAADGFRYPAEWHEHDYSIMIMPSPQNWIDTGIPLADVRGQWADVANKLAEYEHVLMVVRPEDKRIAKKMLTGDIELVEFPVNDGWARDSGPMFVVDDKGNRRVAGFTFNGWGAKFPPYKDDALLKGRLCKHLSTPMYLVDLVLEGGGVAVDGEGTCITTEQCLLHKNRNMQSREDVERILKDSLAVEKIIWLGKGLEPDPVTDGHIDGMLAYAEPGTVLLHTTDDRRDPNYKITQDAKRRLAAATDAKGRKLEVIELPMDGDVSYMNFYIANDAILVPVTKDPQQDKRPFGILKEVFQDDYDVVGIDCNILGEGGGGIHCITQQVPKA